MFTYRHTHLCSNEKLTMEKWIISPLIDNLYCSWVFWLQYILKTQSPPLPPAIAPFVHSSTERQKELSSACFSTACHWPCWASLLLLQGFLVMATEASRWPGPVSFLPIAHLPSCGPSVASDTTRQTVMLGEILPSLLVSIHLTLIVFAFYLSSYFSFCKLLLL